jgi:hypothetical protein
MCAAQSAVPSNIGAWASVRVHSAFVSWVFLARCPPINANVERESWSIVTSRLESEANMTLPRFDVLQPTQP